MANHDNTKKAVRQTIRKTAINKSRVSSIRTSIKKVEAAIATHSVENALAALKQAQSLIMRGVSKGVVKKNTASRKVSRLSARIKKLSSAA